MAYKTDLLSCVDELLGAENWEVWEESMCMLFRATRLFDVVDGARKVPERVEKLTTEQLAIDEYEADCARAQLYITRALSQPIKRHVLGCKTPKEMWDRLRRTFGMGTGQRLDKLLEQFFGYAYEINSELNRKKKAELDECILLGRVLYILPVEYIPVKTVWETESDDSRSLDMLTERIRNHEERIKVGTDNNMVALHAAQQNNNRGSTKSGNGDTKKKKSTAKCPEKSNDDNENNSKNTDRGRLMALPSYINSIGVDAWIADSGCSQHMTSNKKNFKTYVPLRIPISITGIGSQDLLAVEIGKVSIQARVKNEWFSREFKNVLYVPELRGNLFSTAQARKSGCATHFHANGSCVVKRDGQILVTGKAISNGLTILDISVVKPVNPVVVNVPRLFCLKTKDEAAKCIETFFNEADTAGVRIKTLLCDAGTEFLNKTLKETLSKRGIKLRVAMTKTPQQNGAAERENHTVIEAARAMLTQKGLPIKLWAEACNTAVFVFNRTAPTPVNEKSPIELWYGRVSHFDINKLRVFGTKVWYLLPERNRKQKFASKSECGLLVGYEESDGYRVYVEGRRGLVRSCNVTFENELTFQLDSLGSDFKNDAETRGSEGNNKEETEENLEENYPDKSENCNKDIEETNPTRPKRQQKLPSRYNDYEDYAYFAYLGGCAPGTYEEAIDSEDKVMWKKAMDEEEKVQEG
nr:uncharacterized protein LOC111420715 [Onthophagus taurus]